MISTHFCVILFGCVCISLSNYWIWLYVSENHVRFHDASAWEPQRLADAPSSSSRFPKTEPKVCGALEARKLLKMSYRCFLKWWYPQNTPKWSFLVGKPMVVGYHHFRKPPYGCCLWDMLTWNRGCQNLSNVTPSMPLEILCQQTLSAENTREALKQLLTATWCIIIFFLGGVPRICGTSWCLHKWSFHRTQRLVQLSWTHETGGNVGNVTK